METNSFAGQFENPESYNDDFIEESLSLEQASVELLNTLDENAKKFRKEGKYVDSLQCMEKALVLRQHILPSDDDAVKAAFKSTAELCNILAMIYLQEDRADLTLQLLKKAEMLSTSHPKCKAATYNNFACLFRKKGELSKALQYLQKSLKLESRITDSQNTADTHINICAVLSQLGKHQDALNHAQKALDLLGTLLSPQESVDELSLPPTDRVAALAIAYHNVGVEQEFLKLYDLCEDSYARGVEVASQGLGKSHAVTVMLKNSLKSAKKSRNVSQQNKIIKKSLNEKYSTTVTTSVKLPVITTVNKNQGIK